MDNERITRLGCWRGQTALTPIAGGITNRNYVVDDAGTRYVARVCEDLRHLGIDRRNEVFCQAAAARVGIAPAVVHVEDGVLVSQHVLGRTLRAEDAQSPAVLQRVAKTLERLHSTWDELTGELLYFSPFQTVMTYAETARSRGARLPADLDRLLDDARRLARSIRPFHPVLCHNDLLPANVLDDGERIWIVDWEYAGVGNPLFDLASLAANARLGPRQVEDLLIAYCGASAEPMLREIRVYQAVSLLREALWGWIQSVASRIEFDYSRYAEENLAAYRDLGA